MPDRAEIEAVARALAKLANDTAEQVGMEHDYGWEEYEAEAETAIAALDRVRDARGDDEAARSVIAGRDPVKLPPADDVWDAPAARSPQGEDHEAVTITKGEFDALLEKGDPVGGLFSRVEGHFYGVKR